MNSTDKIIEHLIYNPGISRQEIADALKLEIGAAQMKRILAQAIESGDIRTSGKARATRYYATPKAQLLRTINLDSYYAVDADKRQMLTSYNFDLIRTILPSTEIFTNGNKRTSRLMANSLLISRALCPLSFRTVEANDYRASLLLFYEQNNISAFKRMFLEQVEFATNEYF